jgi:hypothetical protein
VLFRDEWYVEASAEPSGAVEVVAQLRSTDAEILGERELGLNSGAKAVVLRRQRAVRVTLAVQGSRHIRFRSRLERSSADVPGRGGTGTLVFQEVQGMVADVISLTARITLFDVDAYEARIFGVEPDLPGSTSLTVSDGRGTRWAVTGSLRIASGLELSAKYLHTVSSPRSSGRRTEVLSRSGGIQLEGRLAIR